MIIFLNVCWYDTRCNIFLKCINPKVNLIGVGVFSEEELLRYLLAILLENKGEERRCR